MSFNTLPFEFYRLIAQWLDYNSLETLFGTHNSHIQRILSMPGVLTHLRISHRELSNNHLWFSFLKTIKAVPRIHIDTGVKWPLKFLPILTSLNPHSIVINSSLFAEDVSEMFFNLLSDPGDPALLRLAANLCCDSSPNFALLTPHLTSLHLNCPITHLAQPNLTLSSESTQNPNFPPAHLTFPPSLTSLTLHTASFDLLLSAPYGLHDLTLKWMGCPFHLSKLFSHFSMLESLTLHESANSLLHIGACNDRRCPTPLHTIQSAESDFLKLPSNLSAIGLHVYDLSPTRRIELLAMLPQLTQLVIKIARANSTFPHATNPSLDYSLLLHSLNRGIKILGLIDLNFLPLTAPTVLALPQSLTKLSVSFFSLQHLLDFRKHLPSCALTITEPFEFYENSANGLLLQIGLGSEIGSIFDPYAASCAVIRAYELYNTVLCVKFKHHDMSPSHDLIYRFNTVNEIRSIRPYPPSFPGNDLLCARTIDNAVLGEATLAALKSGLVALCEPKKRELDELKDYSTVRAAFPNLILESQTTVEIHPVRINSPLVRDLDLKFVQMLPSDVVLKRCDRNGLLFF